MATTNNTTTTASAASTGKRDKRRHGIAMRINYISEQFEEDRNVHYRDMLHELQNTLASLHAGTNEDLLEQVADLEEHRDQELVRLNLWEAYQIDRAEREYEKEITQANEEYTKMTLEVKEQLLNHLEGQRKRLREDKSLLDIANDHLMYLSGSWYADASGNGPGTGTGGASTPNPIPSLLASERRSLRRRDIGSGFEEVSGMSGGEGREYGSGATSTGPKRRKPLGRATGSGEDSILSDRDALGGLLSARGRGAQSGTAVGRPSKSFQPPAALKSEDVQDDLNQLRAAAASLKRKR